MPGVRIQQLINFTLIQKPACQHTPGETELLSSFFQTLICEIQLWFRLDLDVNNKPNTHPHWHTRSHVNTHTHFIDTDVLYISSSFEDWLTQPHGERKNRNEQNDALIVHFNVTVNLMQHLQSLKTGRMSGDEDDRRKKGEDRRVIWFLKGHRHHLCILLHPPLTAEFLAASLSAIKFNQFTQKDSESRQRWRRRRREIENQSGCLPSGIDLSSLHCHFQKQTFKFISNLIHPPPQCLSCNSPTHGRQTVREMGVKGLKKWQLHLPRWIGFLKKKHKTKKRQRQKVGVFGKSVAPVCQSVDGFCMTQNNLE